MFLRDELSSLFPSNTSGSWYFVISYTFGVWGAFVNLYCFGLGGAWYVILNHSLVLIYRVVGRFWEFIIRLLASCFFLMRFRCWIGLFFVTVWEHYECCCCQKLWLTKVICVFALDILQMYLETLLILLENGSEMNGCQVYQTEGSAWSKCQVYVNHP